jgi:AcrR family transcriptional regulator
LSLLAEDGLDGLNLRAVAARLHASPGTLYNYFDNKQAMLEAVMARALRRVDALGARTGDWQVDLRATVVLLHDAFSAQPAAVILLDAGIGAQRMDTIRERLLGLLADAGLSVHDRVQAQNMLVSLAVGDVIVRRAHGREHRSAELARRRALPSDRFPRLTEVARANLEEPGTETFLIGLDALLAVVETMRRTR